MSYTKKNVIEVFTDGSCFNKNDEPVCGVGVFFPNKEINNVSAKLTLKKKTSQRAELQAVIRALQKIYKFLNIGKKHNFNTILMKLDSIYVVNSINIWIKKWKNNNWKKSDKKDVLNQDLLKKIDNLILKLIDINITVNAQFVKAHTKKTDYDSLNNYQVDLLAKKGASKNVGKM